MDQNRLYQALAGTGDAIAAFYAGLSEEDVRWKPAGDKWSLLEILGHLCDEERDDFRRRIRLTLADPAKEWPPIDPPGWAVERRYNELDPARQLADFRAERKDSLTWLQGLADPDWHREYRHPKLGSIKAGDLLAGWVAHDLLHLRQIAGTRLKFIEQTVDPFSTRYAMP